MSLTKDDLAHKYDDLAATYRNGQWVHKYLLGLHRQRKNLFGQLSGNVLDVACGTGENFAYFPANATYTAIDYSPEMLKLARQEAEHLHLPITLHRMDAEQLEFADATFDFVVSTMSTCTFPNPIAALQEMGRVCQPDGRILLIEHGRSSVGVLGRYQDNHVHHQMETAGCRWNQEPLEQVQAAGLQVLEAKRSRWGIIHTIVATPPLL